MALRYTGRADTITYNGETYDKGPDGKTRPIQGLTKEEALHMMEQSNLHSFEDAGKDVLEVETAPAATPTVTGPAVTVPAVKEGKS